MLSYFRDKKMTIIPEDVDYVYISCRKFPISVLANRFLWSQFIRKSIRVKQENITREVNMMEMESKKRNHTQNSKRRKEQANKKNSLSFSHTYTRKNFLENGIKVKCVVVVVLWENKNIYTYKDLSTWMHGFHLFYLKTRDPVYHKTSHQIQYLPTLKYFTKANKKGE